MGLEPTAFCMARELRTPWGCGERKRAACHE
jgi:hypothetical protein